jgi:hypothetical protein
MPNKLRVKVEAVYRDEQESFAAKVRVVARAFMSTRSHTFACP